jgi:hypothetical protein
MHMLALSICTICTGQIDRLPAVTVSEAVRQLATILYRFQQHIENDIDL